MPATVIYGTVVGGFMFGFVRFVAKAFMVRRNEAAKRRWYTFLDGGNSLSKLIGPTKVLGGRESLDHRFSTISVPAKPRTAIVINITVLAGMCVRKSIISLHRYSRADARRRTSQIASVFQR